jgi:DNA-binding GntR family transcriptional regulator
MKRITTKRDIRTLSYERIRHYVASSAVPAGSKINESELAKSLGVSKTPVREALSRLAHDGFVEIIPNRGAFKAKITRDDIDEIMTLREALEGLVIRAAGKHLTEKIIQKLRNILAEFDEEHIADNFHKYKDAHLEFYTLIYRAAKSPRLVRFLQSMHDLSYLISTRYFTTPERISYSVKEHHRMVDALEKGDVDLAESIRKNLVRTAKNILLSSTLPPQV